MKSNCDNISELNSHRVNTSKNAYIRVTERNKQTNKRVNLVTMKCENALELN